jgi:amidohydrolase
MTDIAPLVNELFPALRDFRRDLHAHPEPGHEEVRTAGKVVEQLRQLDGLRIREQVGGSTGVVAVLGADKPGPAVALRADMDCLPMTEETGLPYASTRPGFMHACGHDGHTTALLGAARVLHAVRDELAGPVVFLFQPAEEGGFGGQRLCADGALDDPRVEAVFGLHNMPVPGLEFGAVGLRPGALMGGGMNFFITLTGRGGHAASPHLAIDPIVIGSQVLAALQTLVSRRSDPLEAVVISTTQFHAGTTLNVIPEEAKLAGTIRSLSPAVLETVPALMKQTVTDLVAALGGRAEVSFKPGYPVTYNDGRAAEFVARVAGEVVGADRVNTQYPATLGSEDFSFYLQQRPGAFYFVGSQPPDLAEVPFLHHPRYDFNDDILPRLVTLHVETARRFAREWQPTA